MSPFSAESDRILGIDVDGGVWIKPGAAIAYRGNLRFERLPTAGGLIVTSLSGFGAVAIATHGEHLRLEVTPGNPVSTDPHATVAWSGGLTPRLKTDLSWRSAIGHGGQQPIQMFFEGLGFVIVQPFKDPSRLTLTDNPVSDVAKLIAS